MSKDIIFANGAIQNRGYLLDEVPGKMAGIMASQVLNHLHGNDQVMHLWNNVGAFNTTEDLSVGERLKQKYSSHVMQEQMDFWGYRVDDLEVLTDDEPVFAEWASDAVTKLTDSGTARIEKADFHSCQDCHITIAEATVPVESCKQCSGHNLSLVTEDALFLPVPADRSQLLARPLIYNPINLRREQDALKQIPDRLLLSRDRTHGIRLSVIGLPEKILDPRMGIGLLAVYAAQRANKERVGLVQATSTLIRTAPYIGAANIEALGYPALVYAPHTRIDTPILKGDDPVLKHLLAPLGSLQRNQDVNQQRAAQLHIEYEKLKRNAQALSVVLHRLSPLYQPTLAPEALDTENLGTILSDLSKRLGKSLEKTKRLDSLNTDVERQDYDEARRVLDMCALLP